MNLEEISIETFKKNLYSYYVELFPKSERKSFSFLKKTNRAKKNIFLQITRNEEVIGFMILNTLPNILCYFTNLSKYGIWQKSTKYSL